MKKEMAVHGGRLPNSNSAIDLFAIIFIALPSLHPLAMAEPLLRTFGCS
jgi:hypothetical protein